MEAKSESGALTRRGEGNALNMDYSYANIDTRVMCTVSTGLPPQDFKCNNFST
jgi:hypothetical protein